MMHLMLAAVVAAAPAPVQGTWSIAPAWSGDKIEFSLRFEENNGHRHSHDSDDVAIDKAGIPLAQLDGNGGHVTFAQSRDAGRFDFEGDVAHRHGGGKVTFTPNPAYVAHMHALGYDLDTEEDLTAAMIDITNAYVDGLAAAGYSHLSWHDLVAMRALGVTPQFIAQLASAGYSGLTARELIELRALGIDAEYVKRVQSHGYAHPSVRQLVELKALKVI